MLRGAYKVLILKPEGKARPLGTLSRNWEYNIKIDLKEIQSTLVITDKI
jgi:hypothetical protein